MRFCTGCGAELPQPCPACRFINPVGSRFCGQCAAALGGATRNTPTAAPAERRLITVLFCDVVSASSMSERLDPEDLREVLREFQALCTEVVKRFDGYVAQVLGDGLLVYFGYPQAFEDNAPRAVRTGLAILDEIRAAGPRIEATRGVNLQVRIGIHTGAVVVGDMGDADRPERLAVGETPNIAARVQGLAMADSLVLTEATYRSVKGFFSFRALGPQLLKGFTAPVPLYEVVGTTGARSRLEAAGGLLPGFVGRQRERDLLLDRWHEARAGRAPVVLMRGEAGIGKSRQIRELREQIGEEGPPPALVVECYAAPFFQSTALYPLVDMLERRLALTRGMAPERKRRLLQHELEDRGLDPAAHLPPLAALLGIPLPEGQASPLPPAKLRQATFESLAAWLEAASAIQPVLFVVEDLQWADPSTLELLGFLLERPSPGPLMGLYTHRPDFTAPWSSPRLTELELGRLSAGESQQLVAEVSRARLVPGRVLEQMLERADGVPLFLEEMTRSLLDAQANPAGEGAGREGAAAPAIPATLMDSLHARLDRLGSAKAVAQLASTLGRSFSFELLSAVAAMDDAKLRTELNRLVATELLFRTGERSKEVYVFKHALVQDAAYDSILRSTRQKHHARIARTLAEKFPDIAQSRPELLALHYGAGGLSEEAANQWRLAGQQGLARSNFAEATAAFDKALGQLMATPATPERVRQEIDIRAGQGLAFLTTRGFSSREVEQTYARAADLCEELGDTPMPVLYGVWAVILVRSDLGASQKMIKRFLEIAESSPDPRSRLVAHSCATTFCFWRGDYPAAAQHAEAVAALIEPDPKRQHEEMVSRYGLDCLLYGLLYGGWAQVHAGRVPSGLARMEAALELAERIDDAYGRVTAGTLAAAVFHDAGDFARAASLAERARSIAVEKELFFWIGSATAHSGRALAQAGDLTAGLAQLEAGMGMLRTIGVRTSYPSHLSVLAEVLLQAGRFGEAHRAAVDGLEMSAQQMDRAREPELMRLAGEALRGLDERADAEAQLRQALALARERGAHLFALRVASSLADLLVEDGREAEGRAVVAPALAAMPEPPPRVDRLRAGR